MENKEREDHRLVDLDIMLEARRLDRECIIGVEKENKVLRAAVALMRDAIINCAGFDWKTMDVVMRELTNGGKVDVLVESAPPGSVFRKNAKAVEDLVHYLKHYREAEYFVGEDKFKWVLARFQQWAEANDQFLKDY